MTAATPGHDADAPATRTDLARPRFLWGVLSTGVGTLLPMVFAFVGVLYAVRAIDPDAYGVYLLLVVILQFVSTISELGFATALVRGIHHVAPERRDDLVNTILCSMFLLLLLVAGAALAARPLYYSIYRYELLLRLVLYLPFLLVLTNMSTFLYAVLQGTYRYGSLARVRIVTAALRLGLLLLFILRFEMGVDGLIVADLVGLTIACIWAYAVLPVRRRWTIDTQLLRSTARFGFPLYLNSLLYFAYTRVDILMIGYLLNPAGVAACSIAQRIPQNLKMLFSSSFIAVFFPRMSDILGRDEHDQGERLLNVSLRVMSFVTLTVASAVVLFREELTVLLFSETYRHAALAFALFMVAICIGLMGTIMGNTLVASGYPSAPVRINIMAITSNVLGNLVMIPILGFTGAAWATMLMVCATLPVNAWFLRRRGFRVEGWDYLKPLGILVLLATGVETAGITSVWARLLLWGAFPVLAWLASKPLRSDLVQALEQSRELLREKLRHSAA